MSLTKRPDFETGCKYKTGHKTRYAAENQGKKRGHDNGSHHRLKAYKCTFCGMWHVGKQRGKGGTRLLPYMKKYRKPVNDY